VTATTGATAATRTQLSTSRPAGPHPVVGGLGQCGAARLVAGQPGRHPAHVGRLSDQEVLTRTERAEVVARLGHHRAAVDDRLQHPDPLERGLGSAVQVEQHPAARQQRPLLRPGQEVRPGRRHLLVRRDHQLVAQSGQVGRRAGQDRQPPLVGRAEVDDVDVPVDLAALPPVPARDVAEPEVRRVDAAAGELGDRVRRDLEAGGQPCGVPRGGLELLGARVLDTEPDGARGQGRLLGRGQCEVLVRHHDGDGAAVDDLRDQPGPGEDLDAGPPERTHRLGDGVEQLGHEDTAPRR
jgi:hypothetical protein